MTTTVGNKNISDWNPTLYDQFKSVGGNFV
jgi:hypothetical protein